MRELERIAADDHRARPRGWASVGRHRRPRAAGQRPRRRAPRRPGYEVDGPAGRGEVPRRRRDPALRAGRRDRARPPRSWRARAPFVGHTSGATPLQRARRRAGRRRGSGSTRSRRSPAGAAPTLRGAAAPSPARRREALAVAARARARGSAWSRSRSPTTQRAAYHAAASIASNFLVTLEGAAEAVAGGAGIEPRGGPARCSARSCARRSRTGSRSAPSARSPGPWRAATRRPSRAQRDAVARRPPRSCSRCSTRSSSAPGRSRTRGAGMRTVRQSPSCARRWPRAPRGGGAIGLVPTMGFFHEGHLAPDAPAARDECDLVVVSLFVNPAQFGAGRGPRRLPARRGARRRARRGARAWTCCSRPPLEEVYPDGFATTSRSRGLTEVLDGDPAQRGPSTSAA